MSKARRTPLGAAQKIRLLQEVSGKCPFCGLELIGSLQIHHIDRDASNTADANLLAVCASCHDQLTRELIPDSDVLWRKRALQSGVHPARPDKPAMSVSGTDNRGGIIAQEIHGKVVVQQAEKPRPILLPGSIGASPPQYRYMEYLIGRLTKFRRAGASFGQRRKGEIHPGVIRRMLKNEFGNLPKDLPLGRFDALVEHLTSKINNTALGRRNRARGTRNYHSFKEHGDEPREAK